MDVKSIISQMTLEEKAALCSGKDFWHLDTPQRLGIESVMVSDGPCGIRKQSDAADHLGLNASVPATSYPTGSCMACSFDRELFRRSGEVLGHACTATVNVTSTTQIKRVYTMNSTIEEIMESPVGREILGKMMAQNPLAQADADDIGMGEAMARMMAEMPLRALLSFGGDSVPAGAGEMLLKQLNA